MVGNMMELKKPTASSAHIETRPPARTALSTRTAATPALPSRSRAGGTTRITAEPTNRPIIAPPQ